MEEGDVVDTSPDVGKEIGDILPALAVGFELPLRLDDTALVFLAAAPEGLHRDRLPVHPDHLRLVVEGIDVARTAIHEQEDDALGLAFHHGRTRRQWIGTRSEGFLEKSFATQQSRQRQRGESATDRAEELATVHPSTEIRLFATFHGINRGR